MVSHCCLHHRMKAVHLRLWKLLCISTHQWANANIMELWICAETPGIGLSPTLKLPRLSPQVPKESILPGHGCFSTHCRPGSVSLGSTSVPDGKAIPVKELCSSSYGEHCMRQKLQGIFQKFSISNIYAPKPEHFCLNISLYWGKPLTEPNLYKLGNTSHEDKTFNI